MLEGTFDLYLDGSWTKAGAGDLVRMPRGMPHGYYNRGSVQAHALFWVTPARDCARCSTSCTISAIRRKWCAAPPPTRWNSCHRAACRAPEAQTKPADD